MSEDIGRQVLTYGHREPINEFIQEIEKVSVADVKKAVKEMMMKPPTMATIGDVASVPRYDLVSKRFG